MFIIERRTAGVLAALAITAAMVVLGNMWDRVDETTSTADSPAAFATSVGPGVGPIAFGAPEERTGREIPEGFDPNE